jgi:hypothetical protein
MSDNGITTQRNHIPSTGIVIQKELKSGSDAKLLGMSQEWLVEKLVAQ